MGLGLVGFFVPCALAGSGHLHWGELRIEGRKGGKANAIVGLTLGYSRLFIYFFQYCGIIDDV